ncbi:MAG: ATP-binding protein [Acidobacteria bacterium]|nr:ATP-binding protein [Acidobacteriota bacterium]
MNIAFDTNVFLTKGNHHDDLKKLLFGRPPICRIALDAGGELQKEYRTAVGRFPGSAILKNFFQLISERKGPHVALLKSDMAQEELDELTDYGCGKQIEPALFGIAKNNPDVLLYLMEGKMDRGYSIDRGWDLVSQKYLGDQSTLWQQLRRAMAYPGHPYPRTREELERLLNEYQRAGHRTEHDLLEFKDGPFDFARFANDIYDRSLRVRIAEAVCGMLNTRDGWVFVGIDHQSCEIVGFPPVYVQAGDDLQNKEVDADRVQQYISQDICTFVPKPSSIDKQCVLMWPIDVSEGRIVLAILVTKPEGDVTFTYNGIAYGRLGTTCPR